MQGVGCLAHMPPMQAICNMMMTIDHTLDLNADDGFLGRGRAKCKKTPSFIITIGFRGCAFQLQGDTPPPNRAGPRIVPALAQTRPPGGIGIVKEAPGPAQGRRGGRLFNPARCFGSAVLPLETLVAAPRQCRYTCAGGWFRPQMGTATGPFRRLSIEMPGPFGLLPEG